MIKIDNIELQQATPMFDGILVTANKKDVSNTNKIVGIDDFLCPYKAIQTVQKASMMAKNQGIVEGSKVMIDFSRYAVVANKETIMDDKNINVQKERKGYNIPKITIKGVECLVISFNDVFFKDVIE